MKGSLHIFTNLRALNFGDLMQVYQQSNGEKAHKTGISILTVENDLYDYLRTVFFTASGAFYAVWVVEGRYVSALRMEPYRDGFLLESLETAPEHRNQGYARCLMEAVLRHLRQLSPVRVYAHVWKNNKASLAVHSRCGFTVIKDNAIFLDGSFTSAAVTLCWQQET